MVKLQGRYTKRGKIAFFSHFVDSGECDIKTNCNHLSKEEILAIKYGKVVESERHKRLKNLISSILKMPQSEKMGVSNVEVEKRVNSDIPYLNWRRPDVMAEYNGKKLVFELQLSTTFLSVVVDRDIFYRLNNYYIIWVFNFDDNQEYVNLSNMMCKDIYYSNKRNIFIFDKEAQEKSLQEGVLYFRCKWIDENGNLCKGELISISELHFDADSCKPYYIDADQIYYSKHPEKSGELKVIEHSRQELLEGLMERMNRSFIEQTKMTEQREKAVLAMQNCGETVERYCENRKWGYKYKDVVMIPPYFDSATVVEDGEALVTLKGKQGLINQYGRSIVPCLYREIIRTSNGCYIVRQNNRWRLYGSDDYIRQATQSDHWEIKDVGANCCLAKMTYRNNSTRRQYGRNDLDVDVLIFPDGKYHLFVDAKGDFKKDEVMTAYFCITKKLEKGKKNFSGGYRCNINNDGYVWRELENGINLIQSEEGYMGLAKADKTILIPCIYDNIITDDYSNKGIDRFCVLSDGKWGLTNINNDILVSCKYDSITSIDRITSITNSGMWMVSIDGHFGIVNESGEEVLPLEYDMEFKKKHLMEYNDIMWELCKEGKYGVANSRFEIIVPCKYDKIEKFTTKFLRVEQDGKIGVFDSFGAEILPTEYERIEIKDEHFICKDDTIVYLSELSGKILFKRKGWNIKDFSEKYVVVVHYPLNIVYRYDGSVVCVCEDFEHFLDDKVYVTKTSEVTGYEYHTCFNYHGVECDTNVSELSDVYQLKCYRDRYSVFDSKGFLIAPSVSTSDIVVDDDKKSVVFKDDSCEESVKFGGIWNPKDEESLFGEIKKCSFLAKLGAYIDWRTPLLDFAFTEITTLGNLIFFKNKKGWGIMKANGEIISKTKYDSFRQLSNGLIVCRESEWRDYTDCLYSPDGKLVLPIHSGQKIDGDSDEKGNVKVVRDEKGRWGIEKRYSAILDKEGKFTCNYDSDGLGVISVFEKYGVMKNGEVFLPIEYENIIRCSDGNFIVKESGIDRLVDATGREIPLPIEDAKEIRQLRNGGYLIKTSGKPSCICDKGLNIVVVRDGLSVENDDSDELIKISDGHYRYAYLDSSCNLLPYEEEIVNDEIKITEVFGKYNLLKNGKPIVSDCYKISVLPNIGFAVVPTWQVNRTLLLGMDGEKITIVEACDVEIFDEKHRLLICEQREWSRGRYGIINQYGAIVLPLIFEKIQSLGNLIYTEKKQDKMFGKEFKIYSCDGKKSAIINSSQIENVNDNIVRVGPIANSARCYNVDCEEIQRYLTELDGNYYCTSKDGKYGVVDYEGRRVVENVCNKVIVKEDGSIGILIGSQWSDLESLIERSVSIKGLSTVGKELSNDDDKFFIGRVCKVKPYGLFIQVKGKKTGLLHKSHFMNDTNPFDYHIGDKVKVKIINIKDDGKIDYDFS